jgi:hypothetical protein
MRPTSVHDSMEQVNIVMFGEGSVEFKGEWFHYFGWRDAFLGAATACRAIDSGVRLEFWCNVYHQAAN